jgi:hypothetical protein
MHRHAGCPAHQVQEHPNPLVWADLFNGCAEFGKGSALNLALRGRKGKSFLTSSDISHQRSRTIVKPAATHPDAPLRASFSPSGQATPRRVDPDRLSLRSQQTQRTDLRRFPLHHRVSGCAAATAWSAEAHQPIPGIKPQVPGAVRAVDTRNGPAAGPCYLKSSGVNCPRRRETSLLRAQNVKKSRCPLVGVSGGETGIRTLGTLAGSTVFETAPFDHSGTSPAPCLYLGLSLFAR